MIIQKDIDTKFKSNLPNKTAFTIKASAKAFSILSSNLYKNPVAAILRELSCNAIDAHKAINNKDKFIVHLPSEIVPDFYIQDFGIGMSTEEIEHLYTTYFDSTKNDDNDMIGGLGIGSKTPFAYVKQFTIESIKDHVKTTAMAYLDEESVPSLTVVNVEKTDRNDSGTKVSFSVNQDDIGEFYSSAVKIFLSLEVFPEIVCGLDKFNEELFKYQLFNNANNKSEMFKLYIQLHDKLLSGKQLIKEELNFVNVLYNTIHSSLLIMGGVIYPISDDELFKSLDDTKANILRTILTDDLSIIKVDIGAVSIAPSRESLTYDKQTISFLEQYVLLNIENKLKTFNVLSLYEKIKYMYTSPIGDILKSIYVDFNDKDFNDALNKQTILSSLFELFQKHINKKILNNILAFYKELRDFSNTFSSKKPMVEERICLMLDTKTNKIKSFCDKTVQIIQASKVDISYYSSLYNNSFCGDTFFRSLFNTNSNIKIYAISDEEWDKLYKPFLTREINTYFIRKKSLLEITESIRNDNPGNFKYLIINPKLLKTFQNMEFPIEKDLFNEYPISIKLITPKYTKQKNNTNTEEVFKYLYDSKNKIVKEFTSLKDIYDTNKKRKILYIITMSNKCMKYPIVNEKEKENYKGVLLRHLYIDTHINELSKIPCFSKLFSNIVVYGIPYGYFKRFKLEKDNKFVSFFAFMAKEINAHQKEILNAIKPEYSVEIPNLFKNESITKDFTKLLSEYSNYKKSTFYKLLVTSKEIFALQQKHKNENINFNKHIINVINLIENHYINSDINFNKLLADINESRKVKTDNIIKEKKGSLQIDENSLYNKYPLLEWMPTYFYTYGEENKRKYVETIKHWTNYIVIVDKLKKNNLQQKLITV